MLGFPFFWAKRRGSLDRLSLLLGAGTERICSEVHISFARRQPVEDRIYAQVVAVVIVQKFFPFLVKSL